jgi:hypothetical protein
MKEGRKTEERKSRKGIEERKLRKEGRKIGRKIGREEDRKKGRLERRTNEGRKEK